MAGTNKPLRVLHTSDWHLGRALYGRKRYDEFEAFLQWLVQTIEREAVTALLIAGDVFDTNTPSNRAQQLYYRFLCRMASSCCRHVVVIAGNHDSPAFLNAPRELLKALDVHVIGATAAQIEDEVLVLDDADGEPELIVCAVPYLRDRDIRQVQPGETVEDKERKLVEGIARHYGEVVAHAERRRREGERDVPIIAMGHLFTAGGQTIEGDGVRDLYVGSLAQVAGSIFPASIDYLALGHLHVPQRVGGAEHMRYSGSPLPMGFGEARQQKSVCLVDFNDGVTNVRLVDIPLFRQLEQLVGDWSALSDRIRQLVDAESEAWLEISYDGDEVIGDLRGRLEAAVEGSALQVLRVRNKRVISRALERVCTEETLDELDVAEVFERCLVAHQVSAEQRPQILSAYQEAVAAVYEGDSVTEQQG